MLEDTELVSSNIDVVFEEGSTNSILCVDIPIVNDGALEGNQAFSLEITAVDSPPHAVIISPDTTTVTILDDERESSDVART